MLCCVCCVCAVCMTRTHSAFRHLIFHTKKGFTHRDNLALKPVSRTLARLRSNRKVGISASGALRLELTADWSAADANAVQAEIFVVEVIG